MEKLSNLANEKLSIPLVRGEEQHQNKALGFLVSHTHWDREWRYPIWTSRSMLLNMIDTVISSLESGNAYNYFLLDGQCVPIKDYLELRPENCNRIKKLIASGKLQIGPWYTCPDEFPLDGESLIRNLQKGRKYCTSMGNIVNIGYTTFGWGQSSQLPQIYAGFGINTCFIGKRVSEKRAPQSEFIWEGADGTQLLTSRFGKLGRHNFYFDVVLPATLGRDYNTENFFFKWDEKTLPFHRADLKSNRSDWIQLKPKWIIDNHRLIDGFASAWRSTDETLIKEGRLLMDGIDYGAPHPLIPDLIATINKEFTNIKLTHTDLKTYVEYMRKHLDQHQLRIVQGELRDGPAYKCTMNAIATRIDIKQINRKAENDIIRMAEPLAFMASTISGLYPAELLSVAWNYLLVSHSHDSINGVTTDKTTQDVKYRINQALEIAQVVSTESMKCIASQLQLSDDDSKSIYLLVCNPALHPVKTILTAGIETPAEWRVMQYDLLNDLSNSVEIQPISRERDRVPVTDIICTRPRPFEIDRHTFHFEADLPAFGYQVFTFSPKTQYPDSVFQVLPQLTKLPIAKPDNTLENEFIKITFSADGSFSLLDKRNGTKFEQMGYYEDSGDAGNYWHRQVPFSDSCISSLCNPCRRYISENGHLSATVITEIDMLLPNSSNKQSRSAERTICTLFTAVTLEKGSPLIKLKTWFTNNIKDHRLRILFSTPISAARSDAGGHFTIDRRDIDPQKDNDGQYENETLQHPFNQFVNISDQKAGLAVISDSLFEYEAIGTENTILAFTLLRAVSAIICTEHRVPGASHVDQKLSQMQGQQEYHYAILPHSGDIHKNSIAKIASQFNTPIPMAQTGCNLEGVLPRNHSFIFCDNPEIQIACIKKSECGTGYILRLFNRTNQSISTRIKVDLPDFIAHITNLAEEKECEIDVIDKCFNITIAPSKLVTISLVSKT